MRLDTAVYIFAVLGACFMAAVAAGAFLALWHHVVEHTLGPIEPPPQWISKTKVTMRHLRGIGGDPICPRCERNLSHPDFSPYCSAWCERPDEAA